MTSFFLHIKNRHKTRTIRFSQSAVYLSIIFLLLIAIPYPIPRSAFAVGEALTINAPITFGAGYMLTVATVSGSIFSDSSQSNYFLKPAASGTSLAVAGSVGIGTTAPSSLLEIYRQSTDRTTMSTLLTLNSDGSAPYTGFGSKITWNSEIYNSGHAETGYIGVVMGPTYSTEADMVFATRGSSSVAERMRILGSGYVGIGTTVPGNNLSINGNLSLASDKFIGFTGDTALSAANYALYGNATNTLINTPTSGIIQFRINNAAKMTMDTNGNFGIGLTNPAYKLDVVGDVNASTSLRVGGYILNVPGTTYGTFAVASIRNSYYGILFGTATSNPAVMYDGSGNGGVYYENYGWQNYYTIADRLTSFTGPVYTSALSTANAASSWGDIRTGSIDSQTAYAYTAMCVGNASGTCNSTGGTVLTAATNFFMGKVGIGVTNPASKLSIGGAGFSTNAVSIIGANAGAGATSTYGLSVLDSTVNSTMYVRDDGYGYLKDTTWHYGSDRRLKTNIQYLSGNGLDIINRLKPVKFDHINGTKNQFGFIAQDVQKVIPEIVSVSDEKTGMLALQTDSIIPFLVNAVKELQEKIMAFSGSVAKITELSDRIDKQDQIIIELQAEIEQLKQK